MINVVSFCRPASLEEALDLMASRHLTPVAGGTDIVPQSRDGEPRELIDTTGLGLDDIKVDGNSGNVIDIGASVTHSTLCGSPVIRELLPLLAKAAGSIGCEQIRNRGTIGGNVVNASPSADTVPALLNHDAEVVLVSRAEKRIVKLEKFITRPYETDRKPGELLTSIMCKATGALPGMSACSGGSAYHGASCCFFKLGRRAAMNISRMSLALIVACGAGGKVTLARVAAGAVFPVARRMLEVERLLEGQVMSKKLFEEAGTLATELLVMETGIRWSTPYKMPVLKGLLERVLRQLARDNGVIVE